jgi:hypothetical protein
MAVSPPKHQNGKIAKSMEGKYLVAFHITLWKNQNYVLINKCYK